MNCPKCKASVHDGAQFCGVCGYNLQQNTENPYTEQSTNMDQQSYQTQLKNGLISSSISDGWRIFKANFLLIYIMMISVLVINIVPNALLGRSATGFIISLFIGVFLGIVNAGFSWTLLKAVRGEEIEFEDMFSGFKKLAPLITAGFIIAIFSAIFFGPAGMQDEDNFNFLTTILFIPGVYISLGISQTMLLIMDRNFEGVPALKASWQMMTGYKLKLLILGIALIGINCLGALALLVGLLVTLPWAIVASVAFYDRLVQLNPPDDQ